MQLLLIPQVLGGRAIDFALFRVDALSLALGVVWTLALGLAGMRNRDDEGRRTKDEGSEPSIAKEATTEIGPNQTFRIQPGFYVLFTLGPLGMAYAREPLVLLVGWEVAGLALWLSLRDVGQSGGVLRCALSIHLPGLLLLAAILFGPVGPFVPPQGGEATPWPLFVAISFGIVALWRACCWLAWGRGSLGGMLWILVSVYVLVSPFLLAKALVAAPWDAFGVWSLALLGTVAVVASLLAVLLGADPGLAIALACAAIGVAGLGLAPVSPIAAAGAIALALAAPFWTVVPARAYRGALFLVAALLGVWLLSEGALDARYRLVAAILLPAIVLLAAKAVPSTEYRVPSDDDRREFASSSTDDGQLATINYQLSTINSAIAIALLVAVAVYPQAAVEWVIRPAVGAMAGGVAFPSALVTNWGLGLTVQAAQEQIVASLPATGIALAVFLAWVALYWLRALSGRRTKDERGKTTDGG